MAFFKQFLLDTVNLMYMYITGYLKRSRWNNLLSYTCTLSVYYILKIDPVFTQAYNRIPKLKRNFIFSQPWTFCVCMCVYFSVGWILMIYLLVWRILSTLIELVVIPVFLGLFYCDSRYRDDIKSPLHVVHVVKHK